MPSLPASQPADDGEAASAHVPSTVDPSSEEPFPTRDGARKSVDPPPTGRESNVASFNVFCVLVTYPPGLLVGPPAE